MRIWNVCSKGNRIFKALLGRIKTLLTFTSTFLPRMMIKVIEDIIVVDVVLLVLLMFPVVECSIKFVSVKWP